MLDVFLPCILGLFLPNLVASECFNYLVLCMCPLWALALSFFFPCFSLAVLYIEPMASYKYTTILSLYLHFVLKKNCTVSQAGFELATLP